ncbi:MAG TPA: hypothetical protein VFV87_06105 [Pirellulaceae bacterium]|nr:hypothetical protein [Pirellulaceae bacterium]
MQIANCKLQISAVALVVSAVVAQAEEPASADFKLETIRGKVVFLAEAMQERTGVAAVEEAKDRILALETRSGELIPLWEDVRGRAFRRDERLRKMEVELLVRRYEGSPVVQIIRVFEVAKDGLYEIDYWCDICAIAMYELKECECCQGPIELRKRKSSGK